MAFTRPTSARAAADPDWGSSPRSCRAGLLYVEEGYWEEGYAEVVHPAWATAPTSCRKAVLPALDAGLGVDLDCLVDTGIVITAHGWTVPVLGNCRDG